MKSYGSVGFVVGAVVGSILAGVCIYLTDSVLLR